MTTDDRSTTPARPLLHRRVTVAHASGSERSRLAELLLLSAAGPVIDLTPEQRKPVTAGDLAAAARMLSAERHGDRQAAKRRADIEVRRALEDRDAASARRDELAVRHRRLTEGAAWCGSFVDRVTALATAIEQADLDLAARRAEHRDAQARLARVQEQQAAAAAAIEDADRQLADLEGAKLDESGIRRQLEHANAERQIAHATERSAADAVQLVAARRDELVADLAQLESDLQRITADAGEQPADTRAVREAFAAYEESAALAGVDPAARTLAAAWTSLDSELRTARAIAPPGPSHADLKAAEAEVRAAEAALAEIDSSRGTALTSDQRAALDAAHDAVLAAEERSSRGFARSAGKHQLEEAREAERRLLEEAGFESYIDVVLTGGRRGGGGIRLAAEQRLHAAERRLEELVEAARGSDELVALEADRERMHAEIVELLGVDPGDRVVELLEQHPLLPRPLVTALSRALTDVGAAAPGIALHDAARSWLARQDELAAAHRDAAQRVDATAAAVEQAGRELERVDSELAAASEAAAEAAAHVEEVRRTVLALESELADRTGEDARRLKRLAAGEQLRAQIEAVERTLAEAEAEASEALASSAAAAAAAETALDRAITERDESFAHIQRLAGELPPDRRVEPDTGPEAIGCLAAALESEVRAIEANLASAEHEMARAAEQAERVATLGPDQQPHDGSVQPEDELDALVRLVRHPDRGAVAVLDNPFSHHDATVRDRLLDAVLVASEERPVVLLTDDPEVLGWAITLPADQGTVISAAALLSSAGAQRPAADSQEAAPEDLAVRVDPADRTHVRAAGRPAGGAG